MGTHKPSNPAGGTEYLFYKKTNVDCYSFHLHNITNDQI